MTTSVEEIKNKQAKIPPAQRGHFTMREFKKVKEALPGRYLQLVRGEIVVNEQSPQNHFSIEDFKAIAEALPERRLELINGEIKMSPPPDKGHQKHSLVLTRLFRWYGDQIEALGCEIAVANCFFEAPDALVSQFKLEQKPIPSDVCNAFQPFRRFRQR